MIDALCASSGPRVFVVKNLIYNHQSASRRNKGSRSKLKQ